MKDQWKIKRKEVDNRWNILHYSGMNSHQISNRDSRDVCRGTSSTTIINVNSLTTKPIENWY